MVLHLSITVDGTSFIGLKEGAKNIAKKVRPNWETEKLQFMMYTSGITNQLIGVWENDKNSQLLVRVYGLGTDLFIDRVAERTNIEVLHAVGCGPELYAVFNNGISYEYLTGIPATHDLITHEPVWRGVSQELAKFHRTEVGDKAQPSVFPKIRHFLNLIPEKFDSEKQKRLEDLKYGKELLSKEIDALEKCLITVGCPVVFSHNDLLLENVIWNETTKKTSFIDFEYGAPNYQAFDIGNHFNEFAGVDEVDYKRYPDKDFQYKWIRNYLSHYQVKLEAEVEESEVEMFYIWTNKFALASHLFWACWAQVQAHHSKIDFDFIGYSIIRLDEYFKRKEEFLSLSPMQ